MNGISKTQLDDFLRFADLTLLQVNREGKLTSIRPRGQCFLDWNEKNRLKFSFTDHFLKPNHLTEELFVQLTEKNELNEDIFLWKKADGELSPPVSTFIRLVESPPAGRQFLFFLKSPENRRKVEIPASDRRYIYQAELLPGLIHNINGPFATIAGRVELLHYQHPEIKQLDEVIRVGYRLQAILDNLSFKVVQEKHQNPTPISLNRLLREEVTFLNCDLFFKHQVEKVEDYADNLPDFMGIYYSYSGLLSEIYRFFRQFVNEEKEYVFIIKSSAVGESHLRFSLDFIGEFEPANGEGTSLPIHFEGDYFEVLRFEKQGIDSKFLAYCMEINKGLLRLSCTREALKCQFAFPFQPSVPGA